MLTSWQDELEPPAHGLTRLRQRLRHQTSARRRRQLLGWALATLSFVLILVLPLRMARPEATPLDLVWVSADSARTQPPRVKDGVALKWVETPRAVYYRLVLTH